MIKLSSLLLEYPESKINSILTRWGIDLKSPESTQAKAAINRFDQIKNSLGQKLDIVVLPDTIKNKDYKNIDLYSYEDLLKLIKSYPENPEKIKKDAVEKFVKSEQIDKSTAQSYVARFMANKDTLEYAVKNGTEDEMYTKEEVQNYIPKNLLYNNAYLDPRNWKWESFEQILDALFPSQKQVKDGEENLASTNADKVYDGGGIEIYKGDDVDKCISYNPVNLITKRKKYGWCVTQVGNTNYDYYRFGDKAPTFYFVFDRSKPSNPEHSPFDDKWHAFVIQVTADTKTYIVTSANNDRDASTKEGEGWEGIANIVPSETWSKIKNLKDYFKPIELSAAERGRKFASGKNLSVSEFKELSQDEKRAYVVGKAQKNSLSNDILQILPKYKIQYEGRTITLANIAIDSGQKFPYYTLKDNEALAKRYAVFKSRHENFGKDPLPLPFVKYLDDKGKLEYLNKFDSYLSFNYVLKYFGEKIAKIYVDKLAKDFKILEPQAIKYISDPKLRQVYELYSKLYKNMTMTKPELSDKELEDISTADEISVTLKPLSIQDWTKIPDKLKNIFIKLASSNDLKYDDMKFVLPIILKDGEDTYSLVPKDMDEDTGSVNTWNLIDKNNKIVKTIDSNYTLGDSKLDDFYKNDYYDQYAYDAPVKRVYLFKDLKDSKNKPIILENIYNDIIKKRLQFRANIK